MFKQSPKINLNYAAQIVCVSNKRKHPQADRLSIITVQGNDVITGAPLNIGDYCIYFPLESALSRQYLSYSNSFEKKEDNRNPQVKGFFGKHGRVRAVKLRGIPSVGYIVPVSSLQEWLEHEKGTKLSIDWEKLVGTEFDYYDDIFICKKYTSVQERNEKQKTDRVQKKNEKVVKESKLVENQFKLHSDTPQLGKNIHTVFPNDIISITAKLHGCLPSKQQVKMYDGTSKKIKDVKVGDVVLGYCHKTNKYVPSKVQQTFINGKTDLWYKLTHKSSNGDATLICTGNHQIYTKNRGYIPAENLTLSDTLLEPITIKTFSNTFKDLIQAYLIGDGYLDTSNTNWTVKASKKKSHEAYIDHVFKCFSNVTTKHKRERVSGFGTEMLDFTFKSDYGFNCYLKDLVDSDCKFRIGPTFKLTPLLLAYWYMDDGSLAHNPSQRDRAELAICSRTEEELPHLERALKEFGFNNFTFYKTKNIGNDKEHNRLRLNASDTEILFEAIKHLIPPVFQYKLSEPYRGCYEEVIYTDLVQDVVVEKEVCLSAITTMTSKEYKHSKKYDIQTETSNFVSGRKLIHNSSHVSSNVLIKKQLKWYEKLLVKFGINLVQTAYGNLYSSRKVLKNAYFDDAKNKQITDRGYYKQDIWGVVNEELKGYLEEGMTLYGEIVGYLPEGGFIQKSYDYQCALDEHKFYIYRITTTTPNGTVIEWDMNSIQQWAKQKGLLAVPLYYYGPASQLFKDLDNYPNNEEELSEWQNQFLQKMKDTYLEGNDKLCKTAVPDEGIVLRKEGIVLDSKKLKSFKFFEFEGKQLDSGEVDIETQESEATND